MSNRKRLENLPAVLRILRKDRGKRQSDAAEQAGVPLKVYQKWEEGKVNPDVYSLYVIARGNEITLDDLVERSIPKTEAE